MTDTPSPGAGADMRVRGTADALAALDIKHVERAIGAAEAEALLGPPPPPMPPPATLAHEATAPDAPATAKPAAQSSTILAAITAASPALVLLADDAGRIAHGPALGVNDQQLAAGAVVTVAGAAAAIWGRARATLPISGWLRVRAARAQGDGVVSR